MRPKLFIAASAMAVATPAFAADLYTPYIPSSDSPVYSPAPMAVVGHLELGVGVIDFGDDDNYGIFVGAGRANVPFGGGAWNLEIETGGNSLFDDGWSYSTIGATAHLWTRLNSAALGVYGGVTFPTGATVGTVGVEGEAYFGNLTLGASGDYNWGDCGGSCSFDYWTVLGWADFYFNPNFRLGGEISYLGGGDFYDAWGAALDTEYRFAGTPFSLWGEVDYTSIQDGGPDIWTGLIGFRLFMDGGMTLEEHDKNVPWDVTLRKNIFFD